jgi:type I site-specific restriction endonuclease
MNQAGDYKLESIILHAASGPIDIKGLMVELNVYESIFSPAVYGNIVIADTANHIQNMPIIGQEEIEFKIRIDDNPDNETIDFKTRRGRIYKISDQVRTGERQQVYTLHFTSQEAIENQRVKVKSAFSATADQIVSQVLQNIVKTKTLIKQKHLAQFKIKCVVLKYPDSITKGLAKYNYQDEVDWIVTNEYRNNFIANLSLSLKGNSLILFQFVDKHGKVLYNKIKDKAGDRPVHYVSGETNANIREEIRAITETTTNGIIVASFGTFSTGINIRNLHNIVFTSPSKSRIRTLQSIGRGLRKAENKDTATLIDIADDLTYKSRNNFTIKHFAERVNLYNEEEFNYKIYKVKVQDERQLQTNTIF